MYGKTVLNWVGRHWKKLALWGGGILTLLILFMALVLPGIIRSQAEQGIAKALNRKVTIADVRVNPFTLTATIDGFRLFEPDGTTPFVELSRLKASLSLASLYRFGVVADHLNIVAPRVRLVRTAANRYNFSDILDHLARQPKPKSSGGIRFSINNITITQGSIDFYDQAVAGGRHHTVRNLTLAIPFISNIPHLAEQYTDPHFSAVVNGAPLSFDGKAKPLAKAVEATLNLRLNRLNLPYYLAYLPASVPVTLDKGSLTLDLVVTYRIHASQKPELTISGLTRLDGLNVTEKDGTPLVSCNRLDLQTKTIEVFSRLIDLKQINLDGLRLEVRRDRQGRFNFQNLAMAEKKAGPPSKRDAQKPKAANEPLPTFRLGQFLLSNGSVHFNDRTPKGGFTAALTGITAKLANLSTAKGATSTYELALTGDRGEQLQASGTAVIAPLAVATSFSLSDIKLQRGWPYLQALLTRPVKGTLGVAGAASFTPAEGLTAHDLSLTLQNLMADFGTKDGAKLAALAVSGASFNQKLNRAEIGAITLNKGTVSVSREVDGSLSPLSLLVAQPKPSGGAISPSLTVTTAHRVSPTKDAARPFSYLVKRISVTALNVNFKDNSFQEPPVFSLRNIRLTTGNLSGPRLTPMPLAFSATYGKNAPLRASGTLTPQPFHYRGSVRFSRLPIRDFEAYVPDNVNVLFVGGTLDGSLRLNVGLDKAGNPYGSFAGSAGVRGFHAVDTVQEEDLLKWESLQLDQISGTIAPFSLGIHQIALNDVYSRIAVRKDGTLNLQNLISKPPAPVTGTPDKTPPPAAASPAATPAAAPPKVRIDDLTIQNGTIAFSDVHLPRQFKTSFYRLGGRVTGLSSDMNQFADVDLRGNLENHSPLLIKGRINPLRNDLFVDITISFKDIELSPASPYSGTYLGYLIDKGKLYLDLHYLIQNKQLKAENKIFVDQFTFGRSVASDKATSLPVRLAVALLKDRNGEIHLDLPLTGRTDDPKFSIWGVVWQVVKNLFIKAATSPFALLSSMMGSSEDLSAIHFAFGSSTLTPAEQQKLMTLAKGLNDRPALKVEIKGYVDRERDAEGYRNELLTKKMKQEKYLDLAKAGKVPEGQSADQMTILPNEYSRYLKAVYLKEKFPKPRNFIGMLKDLPDAEMKKLIITNTKVGGPELHQLAADRVATVRNFLIASGKMAPERLFQKRDDIYKAPKNEKGATSRVELDPIAP